MNPRPLVLVALTLFLAGLAWTRPAVATKSTDRAAPWCCVQHRSLEVSGIRIFYREAGDPGKPTILLLHGFASSSHMYGNLLGLLARDFHLVAPDYPGAGFSDYPSAQQFEPTFANLAEVMAAFVRKLGLKQVIVYMQDFGGPVGLRIAVEHPRWIRGLIIQNANAYEEGIAPEQLTGMRARHGDTSAQSRAQVEQLVSREFTLLMYQAGARDVAAMDPTAWSVDSWILENPQARAIQTGLMLDYYSNVIEYPRWQAYLRDRQPRTLIVWGRNDPIFLPAGAQAYLRDLPKARLRLFDTGHFALEEDVAAIAEEIRRTFGGRRHGGH